MSEFAETMLLGIVTRSEMQARKPTPKHSKNIDQQLHSPFSTLSEQGSSKIFLTLGQVACVLKVLKKAAAVPSTTPLMVWKSSVWMLLKFPQSPGGRKAG